MSVSDLLKTGRIPYLNTDPFFAEWDLAQFPYTAASPRQLGQWAREGKLDAGPLSLVDGWDLESEFEPVAPFGIAASGEVQSVLLFSKKPIDALAGAKIGVTDQTSTSVRLLEIILKQRYGVTPNFSARTSSDDAQLLIGDEALLSRKGRTDFPLVVDLGREWTAWKKRPFVFARWMIRRTLPAYLKQEFAEQLEKALKLFETAPRATISEAARRLNLPSREVEDYLSVFTFRLGAPEIAAAAHFRELLTGKATRCLC
jgi:chorismate dehydratase